GGGAARQGVGLGVVWHGGGGGVGGVRGGGGRRGGGPRTPPRCFARVGRAGTAHPRHYLQRAPGRGAPEERRRRRRRAGGERCARPRGRDGRARLRGRAASSAGRMPPLACRDAVAER